MRCIWITGRGLRRKREASSRETQLIPIHLSYPASRNRLEFECELRAFSISAFEVHLVERKTPKVLRMPLDVSEVVREVGWLET
jgi:hypothetical protein